MFLRDINNDLLEKLALLIFRRTNDSSLSLLLPEQRFVISCHAEFIWDDHFKKCGGIQIDKLYEDFLVEVRKLAEQEIEPGMFKNENTL
jgi:hypothetical protein